jgi:hypothetical protein
VDLTPVIKEIQAAGFLSYEPITRELNACGIRAARGGRWRSQQLWPVLTGLSLGLTKHQSRQISFAAKLAWMAGQAPVIMEIQACGHKSSLAIASELNARGLRAYRGGRWLGCQVLEVLKHMAPDQHRYLTQAELLDRIRPIIGEIQRSGISSAFTSPAS